VIDYSTAFYYYAFFYLRGSYDLHYPSPFISGKLILQSVVSAHDHEHD
jgi:hypothetical protein